MAPKESTLIDEPSGTSKYMSMYGKFSTDGFLRIGNECPDFSCKTTHGHWPSFHEWKRGQWAVLCSHPRAFHPVGTTELGSLSSKYEALKSIGCKIVALSVDSVEDHQEWLKDVEAYHRTENPSMKVQFPIISDGDRSISEAYSMIDPFTLGQQTLTVRSVFVINPDNVLMLRLDYPACVGRNMDEIVRCVMALKLSYESSIQTPANWPKNTAVLQNKDGTTEKTTGAVFLLPTVDTEEANQRFPGYHVVPVPSGKSYLRMVKPYETGAGQDKTTEVSFSSDHSPLASSEFREEAQEGAVHKNENKEMRAQKKKLKHKKGLSKWIAAFSSSK